MRQCCLCSPHCRPHGRSGYRQTTIHPPEPKMWGSSEQSSEKTPRSRPGCNVFFVIMAFTGPFNPETSSILSQWLTLFSVGPTESRAEAEHTELCAVDSSPWISAALGSSVQFSASLWNTLERLLTLSSISCWRFNELLSFPGSLERRILTSMKTSRCPVHLQHLGWGRKHPEHNRVKSNLTNEAEHGKYEESSLVAHVDPAQRCHLQSLRGAPVNAARNAWLIKCQQQGDYEGDLQECMSWVAAGDIRYTPCLIPGFGKAMK